MKRILISVISVLLITAFTLSSFAVATDVVIDGYTGNVEWVGAESETLFNSREDTSSKIANASLKTKFNKNNYDLYIGFSFEVTKDNKEDKINCEMIGIILEIEGCEKFTLDFKNAKVNKADGETYNEVCVTDTVSNTEYKITGAMVFYENGNQVNCEVEYETKRELPESVKFNVCFTDDDGNKSFYKDHTAVNSNLTTTTVTTQKAEKTTKEKTTKEKTTKETTTQAKTHRVDNKTTTKKATTTKAKAEKTTKATTVKTTAVTTAKEKTTKEKTTKEKTTKATTKAATVYYEKEVVVSEVYVTESTTAESDSVFGAKNVSKSTIYKIITGVCAAVLFGVIGIWAVRSKGADKKEEQGDETEEISDIASENDTEEEENENSDETEENKEDNDENW